MKLRSGARELVDFLLPTGCLSCRAWIPRAGTSSLLCHTCRIRLAEPAWPRCPRCHHPSGTGRAGGDDVRDCIECRAWPSALTRARYAVHLDGPAADLVHALKYEGWVEAAAEMGDRLATVLARHGKPVAGWTAGDGPLLVPVPTTRARLRRRGYNQSLLLAERVAATTGLPLLRALSRPRATDSQTRLAPAARAENVRGAFALRASARARVRAADIVLVDDVLTTGATAGEAAVVLGEAGAATVTLVAFARSTPPRPGSGS